MRLPAKFETRLALIALAGLGIRLLYAVLHRKYPVVGDALTFHLDAQHLADGHGFMRPFEGEPTAEHPPLHIVVLAFVDLLGGGSTTVQRAVMGLIGTGTVVALGVLGRTVAGARAGLIAAALAAVYPLLWVIDGAIMSETEYVLLITLVLLASYGYLRAPSVKRGLLVGALIALAALTRGEALALLGVLVVPLVWHAWKGWGARLRAALVIGAAFCAVLAPWTIRNAVTFEHFVLISTNGDNVFVGANCERSYYGDLIGSWAFSCFGKRAPGDESEYSRVWRQRGLDYARDHAGRIPVVVAARLGRQFDLYRPRQGVYLASGEGRDHRVQWLGVYMFWAMLPLGVAGAVVLRRRGEPLFILGAPFFLIVLMGAAVYGSTRFRVAFEPVLVTLSAVALDALWSRVAARRAASSSPASGSDPASSAPASATPTSVRAGISQSQSMEAWNT
jgi:4-amino-4-deoxy-L-arabinose transferase-like glycosyltransferase